MNVLDSRYFQSLCIIIFINTLLIYISNFKVFWQIVKKITNIFFLNFEKAALTRKSASLTTLTTDFPQFDSNSGLEGYTVQTGYEGYLVPYEDIEPALALLETKGFLAAGLKLIHTVPKLALKVKYQ